MDRLDAPQPYWSGSNWLRQLAGPKTMATSQTGMESPQSVRQQSCIPALQLTRQPSLLTPTLFWLP